MVIVYSPSVTRSSVWGGHAAGRGGCAGQIAQRSSTSACGSMLGEDRSVGDLRQLTAALPATSDRL